PELSVISGSQALEGPALEHHAGLIATCGHELRYALQLDGRQVVTHLVGLVAAVSVVVLAELSVDVFSPTFEGAIVKNRARVLVSRADRLCCPARAQVDDGKGIAHLVGSHAAISCVAETELPPFIRAPTLHRTIVQQSARMCVGRGYLHSVS